MIKNEKIVEQIKVICVSKPLFGHFKKGEIYTATKTYYKTTRRKLVCNIKYSLPYIAEYNLSAFGFGASFKTELDLYDNPRNMFEKFSNFFIPLAEHREQQLNEILNDE